MTACAQAAHGMVQAVDSRWNTGDKAAIGLTRTTSHAAEETAGPGVSIADAALNEAAGTPLQLQVTLGAPPDTTVSIRYRTRDGTAVAGEDCPACARGASIRPG